jgi:hypothetical protein
MHHRSFSKITIFLNMYVAVLFCMHFIKRDSTFIDDLYYKMILDSYMFCFTMVGWIISQVNSTLTITK